MKVIKKLYAKRLQFALFFMMVAFAVFTRPVSVHAMSVSLFKNPYAIQYQTHVSNIGWQVTVENGATGGAPGEGEQLEAVKINLSDSNGKSMIKYRAHVADIGWQDWVNSNEMAGTTGESRGIEAVEIKLKDSYSKKYDIYYRLYIEDFGWLGWAKNGETAGSTGFALHSEAIQIKLVKKNAKIERGGSATFEKPALTYKVACATDGWNQKVKEGEMAGTTGQSKAMEAINLTLKDNKGKSGIEYNVHVANIGWLDWKSSGTAVGTVGSGNAIEAVQMKLSQSLAKHFDVHYRMHVAGYGWLGWAKNGELAGTTGGGIQAEAIEIKLVEKDAPVDQGGVAYIDASQKKLVHRMSGSLKQGDYAAFYGSDNKNYGCCAMAYAIGLSIVNNCSYDPTIFWRNGLTYYDAGGVGANIDFNAQSVYDNLANGKPTMLNYGYATGGQHWVLIIGVKQGAQRGNLALSDFIVIDPNYGTEMELTSSYKFTGGTIKGMKMFL